MSAGRERASLGIIIVTRELILAPLNFLSANNPIMFCTEQSAAKCCIYKIRTRLDLKYIRGEVLIYFKLFIILIIIKILINFFNLFLFKQKRKY